LLQRNEQVRTVYAGYLQRIQQPMQRILHTLSQDDDKRTLLTTDHQFVQELIAQLDDVQMNLFTFDANTFKHEYIFAASTRICFNCAHISRRT
jgi:hypothetical protein